VGSAPLGGQGRRRGTSARKVFKNVSDPPTLRAPTYDSGPPGPRPTPQEQAMNGMDDQDPTTLSPRADDVTAASAWSSSPLGDPADRAEYHPYRNNLPPDFRPDFRAFPADPITAAGRLKSISKATLAAGLVGTIGVGAALGMAVFVYTNSSQVRPLTVVPGSTGVPAAFPTAGVQSVPRWSARQRRRPPRCRLRGRARTRHRRPRRQRTRRPWPRRRSSPHRRPPPADHHPNRHGADHCGRTAARAVRDQQLPACRHHHPGDECPQRDAADHVDRASRGWRRRLTIGHGARLTKPAERGPYGRPTAAVYPCPPHSTTRQGSRRVGIGSPARSVN
jgi:hypothetical protein